MSLAQLFYLKESIRRRVRRPFRPTSSPRSSHFTMEPLENRLLLSMTPVAPDLSNVITDATNLEPNPITQAAAPNQTVSFQLDYQDTGSGTGTNGLGLRIHYNSSQLRPGEAGLDGQFGTTDDVANLTNLISTGSTTFFQGIQDQADTANYDGDASTDRFVLIAWSDFANAFPKGPERLLIANWTTTDNFTGTTVNFTTSSRPIGRVLNATPAEFTLVQENTAPELGAIGNRTVDELEAVRFTATANDVDAGQTLTYSLDAAALALGATIDATTGEFYWTPTEAQGPGVYAVTITATDNGTPQLSDSETISITVNEVNQPPFLLDIGNRTAAEGLNIEFTINAEDADLPANTLTFSASNLPTGATFDAATRTFSWTPTEDQGPNIFTGITFTVSDGQGGTDSETISITVNELNQAPELGAIGNRTVQVGQTLTFTVTATDADLPANLLTLSSSALPTGATFDAATGVFSWTPTAGQVGDTGLTFTVLDNGTPQLSDSETITISVTAVNNPPTVDAATFTLDENSVADTVVGTVTATDQDAGQTLTFSITSGNVNGAFQINGTTGVISVANSAALDYETTPQFVLTVQALDNGVPALSGSNSITINLTDVNEAPTLTAPGTAGVAENTTTVATVTASDPDAGTTLTFSLSGADAGQFELVGTGNQRTLRFVSAPDYEVPTDTDGNNVYDVTVTVSDGTLSETRAIAVTVTDVNEGETTPFIINGTKKNDRIVVREEADGWLSVTVNGKTSQVQLQAGQELHVFGLGGDDRITLEGLTRNALVDGGTGNDKINASGVTSSLSSLVLLGGEGDDLLAGGAGSDRLEGGNGEDVLAGHEGDDTLLGGNGRDLLIGGVGNDVLEGNNGNDALLGGSGLDTLYGGNGKDTLIADAEDSVVDGGNGPDIVLMLDQDPRAQQKQDKLLSGQPSWIRQFAG